MNGLKSHSNNTVEFLGKYDKSLQLADLHMHTTRSDGILTPGEIVDLAYLQGLNAVAITDHERIDGGLEAVKYADKKQLPIRVISGCELSTKKGHLLALNLHQNIPSGRALDETILSIHQQGGLVIVPHPKFILTRSLGERDLKSVMESIDPEIYFDGFEVFNGAVYDSIFPQHNYVSLAYYFQHRNKLGAAVGGTDGHYRTVGRGLTGYRGDIIEAIKSKRTAVFHKDEREVRCPSDMIKQTYAGMILEPRRKLVRLAQRRLMNLRDTDNNC
jgi:histidinol phosphatase-like PHP family hydrolase